MRTVQKRHAFIYRGIGLASASGPRPVAREPGGDPHLNLTTFAGQRSVEPLGICLADQHRPCVAQAKSFISLHPGK
jgi:hypothetical protein